MDVQIKDNWLYETTKDPFFTIGCTLCELGIAKDVDQQKELSYNYKCFKIYNGPSDEDPNKEAQYITEITDKYTGQAMKEHPQSSQLLIMHRQLFKTPNEKKDI